jgi:hypothetical protein
VTAQTTAAPPRPQPRPRNQPQSAAKPNSAVTSAPEDPGPRRRANPVLRLRFQAGAALLATAALAVAALLSVAGVRSDLTTFAGVTEPRAATAADLYQSLADLDAQRAKSLVVGYPAADTGAPAQGGAAAQGPTEVDDGVLAALTAQADRRQVGQDVRLLAADTTGDPAATAGVQNVLDGLARYDALGGVQDQADSSQSAPIVGRPDALALNTYDQAQSVLDTSLLPQVDALRTDADQRVAALSAQIHTESLRSALLLAGLGLLTVALLVWWQLDLTRRYRRWTNPYLLAATACVLAVALGGGIAFSGTASEARAAQREGHVPFAVLAQARVTAADAYAVENRWLVDPAYRDLLGQQYSRLTGQLAAPTSPSALRRANADGTVTGLLALPVGTPAATAAEQHTVLDRYADYLDADARLRALAGSSQTDQAALLLTGVTRGDLEFAYFDFSSHLNQLSDDRAAAFTAHAGQATDDLSGWTAVPAAVLAVALLLILLGVRLRLAEYR